MSKSILIVTFLEHGHMTPFQGPAESLKKLGYKVFLLCNNESTGKVENMGFRPLIYNVSPCEAVPLRFKNDWKVSFKLSCAADHESFGDFLKENTIDCLLIDENLAVVALHGYRVAIPVAMVCIHLPLSYRKIHMYAPCQFYSGPFRTAEDRQQFEDDQWEKCKQFIHGRTKRYIDNTKALIEQVSFPSALVSQDTIVYPFLTGYPCLILCPSAFQYPGPIASHDIYCGPSFTSEVAEVKDESKPSDATRRPLFVVSFGSQTKSYANVETTFQLLVTAFAKHPEWDVIVSFGAHLDPMAKFMSQHHPTASHIKYDSWIDQATLIRSRASVLVTHGGMSSVKEAIYHFVPMLVFPQAHDQFGNAARVEFHKIGLALPSDPAKWIANDDVDERALETANLWSTPAQRAAPEVTVDRVEAALRSVLLTDEFKVNVTKLGLASRQEQHKNIASTFIHNMIQNNKFPCEPP